MNTTSSLNATSLSSPVNGSFTVSMVRTGLLRPGIAPVCGPSTLSGMASENVRP